MQILFASQTTVSKEEENEVSVFKSDWLDACEKKTVFVASNESDPSQTRINKNDLTEIALLKPGDHIGWDRNYPITHHAIVVETDITNEMIKVVHNNKLGIVEGWIKPATENGVLIRFDYPTHITDNNPPDRVLERAKQDLGRKSVYHLLKRNCEHFATWCKTGKVRSAQVERRETEAQVTVVCNTVTAAGKQGLSAVERSLSKLFSMAENVVSVGKKIAPLFRIFAPVGGIVPPMGGQMNSIQSIMPIACMGGKMISRQSITPVTMGLPWIDESRLTNYIVNSLLKRPYVAIKAEAKKATSIISKRVGIGLTVAFETIHCGYNIYQYYKQTGGILNPQFIRNALQRISEGVFSTACCVAGNCKGEKVGTALGTKIGTKIGAAVGSVIPVAGPIVGGFTGGFIGSAIGGIAGACVGKVLGATVGRYLTNLFW